jgi:hypothetical protein
MRELNALADVTTPGNAEWTTEWLTLLIHLSLESVQLISQLAEVTNQKLKSLELHPTLTPSEVFAVWKEENYSRSASISTCSEMTTRESTTVCNRLQKNLVTITDLIVNGRLHHSCGLRTAAVMKLQTFKLEIN